MFQYLHCLTLSTINASNMVSLHKDHTISFIIVAKKG